MYFVRESGLESSDGTSSVNSQYAASKDKSVVAKEFGPESLPERVVWDLGEPCPEMSPERSEAVEPHPEMSPFTMFSGQISREMSPLIPEVLPSAGHCSAEDLFPMLTLKSSQTTCKPVILEGFDLEPEPHPLDMSVFRTLLASKCTGSMARSAAGTTPTTTSSSTSPRSFLDDADFDSTMAFDMKPSSVAQPQAKSRRVLQLPKQRKQRSSKPTQLQEKHQLQRQEQQSRRANMPRFLDEDDFDLTMSFSLVPEVYFTQSSTSSSNEFDAAFFQLLSPEYSRRCGLCEDAEAAKPPKRGAEKSPARDARPQGYLQRLLSSFSFECTARERVDD